ncbi:MAG: HAMP domain-containing sensor histidine kinase [Vicinamibacteraceae bacterium]
MPAHVSGAGLGAALALTSAAASLAVGMPLRRSGLLLFLVAVLVSTRWWGRVAGYVSTATGALCSLILLVVQAEGTAIGVADLAATALLGLLGTGIAAWTGPRERRLSSVRDARRVKEEFLATVSHELRTPLNAILGWTELLRTRRCEPSQQVDRGLEVIDRNARRQLALVEELLAAADPPSAPDDWQLIDLRAMLTTLLNGLEGTAAVAQVELAEEATAAGTASDYGGAEPVWVRGDGPSLRLALRHLVENAIKFTPGGGSVRTCLRQSGDRVLLFVTDTGPGIEPRHLEHVFEPFTQQDGSAVRAHGGLGLGLTIARRLVERHGGHLDLRSDVTGSTVLVTLPVDRPT